MRRPRPPSCTRPVAAAGATLLFWACASPGATDAPGRPPARAGSVVDAARAAPVQRLLDASEIHSIVTARAPEMTRRVALMAGDLTDAELERLVPAVRAGFEPARLRDDVAEFLRSEARDDEIERVLAWMEGGASAELHGIVDAEEPTESLEEYARSLMADPPDEARVELVVEWVRVQGAGDFYVLLDQALAEAAHTIVRALRPDAPRFTPPSGEPLRVRLERSFDAAVVSFLRAFEPVPDDLLGRATAEYASPEGQWYVEAYALGVARAMRAGAGRVVEILRDRGRGAVAPPRTAAYPGPRTLGPLASEAGSRP